MFDFCRFIKKNHTAPSNVVKFPEPKQTPPEEAPAKIFYRFGITDKNRLAFQMGYSEITMNKAGVQTLIEQLEFFKNQLVDEDGDQ